MVEKRHFDFCSQIKAEFKRPPKEWTLRQKWEYHKTFGLPYTFAALILSMVGLSVIAYWYYTRIQRGFSWPRIPLQCLFYGYSPAGLVLMCLAAKVNWKNSHPFTATLATLAACFFSGMILFGLYIEIVR